MKYIYIKSYAKLNLYLRVLNKRKDNYHSIITLFERIDLYDRIHLRPRKDSEVRLICADTDLPQGKSNLACQAAYLLQEKLDINKGIDIRIKKRIPIAAGLGGGSSNAAAVLIGLNRLWNLNLNREKLISFGKMLGADVPFFLYATSFALGLKRGDQIKIKRIKNRFWHVLVVPEVRISTAAVYRKLDQICRLSTFKPVRSAPISLNFERKVERLTKPLDDVKMLLLTLRKNNLVLLKKLAFNQLETAASELYPKLTRIKNELLNRISGDEISISGSGPAMFVFVSSRKEGERLCRQLGRTRQRKVFLVRTI